ncbi:MAG: flagellin [Lachnospiraceae bacterium]|nr:flagellin [Lachnospiraceae bacterium]
MEDKYMLSFQNNLLAINANNHLQANSRNNSRTTEKLSSGYRINRAADDAAGLAISEKMRRQLRGLMQGASNARDGVSFVQVADGAMDEVHGMMQRMNELAVKSLNGTWTESGRSSRDPIYLLVGVETQDMMKIPRTRVSSCSLAINSITISRPKYAEKAVKRIKEAITLLSSRRSTYGSMQNRLEHTINNNNNVIENTQASESAIRDADIAAEIMEHSVNTLLMQASQAMLAQANQQPRQAIALLQF